MACPAKLNKFNLYLGRINIALMTPKPDDLSLFYRHAEEQYDKLKGDSDAHVIMYYIGDLSNGFANAIATRLELMLHQEVENRRAVKRFFSVFIEAIQNIRIHGVQDQSDRVHASLIVYTKHGKLCARFANIVSLAQARMLERRYSEVNQMEHAAIKEKYLEILQEGEVSEKGGAGLGILTIVMRSRNPSPVSFTELGDTWSIFATDVCVDML